MSGTSLDGMDAALVKIMDDHEAISIELVHFTSITYSLEIKEALLRLCHPDTAQLEQISMMNMYLGHTFSTAANKVITEAGFSKEDILLIGSHGQTIYHQPHPISIEGQKITSTLQIGDIGVIAEKTGVMTVGDFRTRDMAAGGLGAPLVPYVDHLLFSNQLYGRVLVNIGGIANITILPKNAKKTDVFAYDTGPGNMVIDAFTRWSTNDEQTYDHDGQLAALGNINELFLSELLENDYFKRLSPKTTGRELFGEQYAERVWKQASKKQLDQHDRMMTITELTARTIVLEIQQHVKENGIKEVLISGGGRYNQTLMNRIAAQLPGITVLATDHYHVDADAKEAIAFAILGYQCYHQRPNNIPSATGAKAEVVMGKIAW